jgi:hypothetical protein
VGVGEARRRLLVGGAGVGLLGVSQTELKLALIVMMFTGRPETIDEPHLVMPRKEPQASMSPLKLRREMLPLMLKERYMPTPPRPGMLPEAPGTGNFEIGYPAVTDFE